MMEKRDKKYIYLGFPQSPDSPSPPAIPPIRLQPFLTITKDGANVTTMTLTSHTGTHLDVPRHVIADGNTLTDLAPDDFIFHQPFVVELALDDCEIVQPEHLRPIVDAAQHADFLLFRFGYGPVRRMDAKRYSLKSPGFGVESARFLRDHFPRMRGIGMDVPSLSCIAFLDDTFPAHHALLEGEGRRFIVVEDLNLEQDLRRLETVIVAPLLVGELDGGPCNVIGVLSNEA